MPLLSIIVPVYNKEEYIDSCIQSILNQSFTDFELILIDDGSTDRSALKCKHFETLDNRVKVIHQVNKGVSSARNTGLELAKGSFIGFVDCDDLLMNDMYELLTKNIITYKADISICGIQRISSNKTEKYFGTNVLELYNHKDGLSALLKGRFLVSVYDKIYKAELVRNIRFEGKIYEDFFFNFLAFKEANTSVFEDVIKYNYIIRDSSHSMATFSPKFMDMVNFSQRTLELCLQELPEHIEEAKIFDFNTNMQVLNLILYSSIVTFQKEFIQVKNNLKNYSIRLMIKNGLPNRFRIGFPLFRLSPKLYSTILHLYGFVTNSEHLQRKLK